MILRETNSFRGESVNVCGRDNRRNGRLITTRISITHVIDQDKNDIGLVGLCRFDETAAR